MVNHGFNLMVTDTMTYGTYFVWKKPPPDHTYQVVRREVRARTLKGYPISYELRSIPGDFESLNGPKVIGIQPARWIVETSLWLKSKRAGSIDGLLLHFIFLYPSRERWDFYAPFIRYNPG
jgi:hypothetical protein